MLALRTRAASVVALALLTWFSTAAVARAQNEAASLERAIELFEQGDYLATQETLLNIDRDKLSAAQRTTRDEYLNRVQVAITMNEKALRDLEDAETALEEGESQQAVMFLERVLANEYAADALRDAARAHLRRVQDEPDQRAPQPPPGGEQPAEVAPAPEPESTRPSEKPATQPAAATNGQRAAVLTREADEMAGAGRYDEARRLYEDALASSPGFPEAVAGLRRLAQHEQNVAGERGESLIDRIRRQNQINWQRSVSEYRDVERNINDLISIERFDEARSLLVRARQIVEAGKQYADPISKYESLHGELQAMEAQTEAQERLYHERKVAEVRREVEDLRRKHLQDVAQKRERQVSALMEQAVQHRKDGDLDAAIDILKQVTVIDPKYKPARWMMDDLEDQRQYQYGRELRETLYDETRKSLNDVEEWKIPWHEQLRYPKNWPELIARPERRRAELSRSRSRLISALDKPIPVDFDNDPFGEVMGRLADAHKINLIINWNDLQRAGVTRDVPIDLHLPRQISLKRALTEVLDQAGSGLVDISYDVYDDAVKVATRDTLDKQVYAAAYDVNDLLMAIPMFRDSPMTDLTEANRRALPASIQRREQPWRYGDDDDDEPEANPERVARVQKLINLIQETIAPDSWYDRGGTIGTIKEINGQLVVTQNSAAQQQIGNLLGKLREQRAIQIAVEARFITVSSHYLEELGIDIDVVLNAGNAGYDFIPTGQGALRDPVLGNTALLPRSFSRLGFTPAVPALGGNALLQTPAAGTLGQPFGQPQFIPQSTGGSGRTGTPVPIINQVTSFTDPSSLGSDVPGSFAGQTIGPALSVFGSFLDNIQVDFLLRATQADSRSTVLTAPQLVLFNGQRSWVAVTIQQNFITQLTPVVATGAVAQAPQVGTIDAGAVLDVEATVTADKRYVTMTLRPGVTRLLDLQTIPFSGGGAGGGFGGGTALNAFIQLPQLQSQRIQTTVSIPDGGTLLIGGQKLATETEVEAGVPILSKIPILKRAYSSRSMVKDEQTLLILIKPKILIQAEQEELAFPSFREG